jgi:hypothetical protein
MEVSCDFLRNRAQFSEYSYFRDFVFGYLSLILPHPHIRRPPVEKDIKFILEDPSRVEKTISFKSSYLFSAMSYFRIVSIGKYTG